MSPWLFKYTWIYLDVVVREVNIWLLGKGLELLGRFEINQLLFSHDTALVADSKRSCLFL